MKGQANLYNSNAKLSLVRFKMLEKKERRLFVLLITLALIDGSKISFSFQTYIQRIIDTKMRSSFQVQFDPAYSNSVISNSPLFRP